MSTPPAKCYRHSARETRLQCGSCEQYICAACAHQTPVSTKCPACISAGTPSLLKVSVMDRIAIFAVPLCAAVGTGVIGTYYVDWLLLGQIGLRNPLLIALAFMPYQLLVGLGAGTLLRTVKERKLAVNRIYIAGAAPVVSYMVTNLYNISPFFTFGPLFQWTSLWLMIVIVAASAFIALRMVR